MKKGTLTQLFFTTVDRHAGLPAAFRSKVGGAWVAMTHREALDRVQAISLGLRELGVAPGNTVAIISENRPEWALADYACLATRAADVPIYPTLTAKQTEYILKDSESVAVFCSTAAQLEKVLQVKGSLPHLRHVIVFDAGAAALRSPPAAMSLAELEGRGRGAAGRYPDWRHEALSAQPDDLATLIYTSGTTGDPKGVMLTHYNIWSNVQACLQIIPIGGGDECLSMLPLSHSYERMVDYTLFQAGVIINYAESFDTVAANLQEVKPTVVLSVPRLYEKVYARVLENALSGSAIKRSIFFWAKRAGEQWATLSLAGVPVPGALAIKKKLADRLVFSKLRARTGGRIRFFVSGAAPLSADIAKFFYSAGLPVIEGYGLTESSPVLTLNPLDGIKLGTVGRAIPGVELKIASDGEILARGPNIMQGYYKLPEATRETINPEGWLLTGDIGVLDSDGYLKITDRKKELLKTAGGKFIAPQPIEGMVKRSTFVANAMLYGDRRKFPIMLVVPNFENLERWARERGLSYGTRAQLLELADVKAKVEREVMGSLHDLAKFETPKKVVLLESDFTIESGELTPTLKVKRRVVERNYKTQIDAAYAADDALAAVIERN
ncbi:MAG TPA: long-chain fatty acid--CoA ligase [Gemmatimonadales bacterium]|nr:long-chain fatty acid--CoA ligase [Gemmatimonadales bacterium]